MKLHVTHSYFLRLDPKQWKTAKPYPPLGTLYALASLRQRGHDVTFTDTMFAEGPEVVAVALDQEKPDALVIYDDSFNWLTKMCLSTMQEAAFAMIDMARERGLRVVICSSDASDHRERYLARGADAVILGEGEVTLSELADAWQHEAPEWSALPGLATMAGGTLELSEPRPKIRDLDELPRPAWDLIDLAPYEKMWRQTHGRWSLNLVSSRGCPYACSWCAKPIWGNQYAVHSPERMISDLHHLKTRYAVDHIWFCDDIFGLKPEWAGRFADGIAAAGIDIRFMIQTRADSLLRGDVAADLARAGLETAWLGAESGSQKIVDAMNKGVTVGQIYDAVRLLQALDVRVALFLQFGYLGETREDIDLTIRMVTDLLPDEIGVSVSYPLPGTPFYDQVASQLEGKTNWTDSDDLALMYRGTYQPAYYRRLHRYVHKVFQTHRGWRAVKDLVRAPWRFNRGKARSALAVLYYLPAAILDRARLRLLERA